MILPIKWEKMRLKLEAAARVGIEKAITFEFSHFMSPNSMYQSAHGLFDRVGNIMELKVQKNPVASGLYLSYYLRPLSVEKLHTYLDKGLSAAEPVKKLKGLLRACKIAGHYYILTHCVLLL